MTHAEYLRAELEEAEKAFKQASELRWFALKSEQPEAIIAKHLETKNYWAGYVGGITNALHAYNGQGE